MGAVGAPFGVKIVRTPAIMVESSALIAGMPGRTWCPQAFAMFPVFAPVPTGATSSTTAAPIDVVSGGDNPLNFRPFGC